MTRKFLSILVWSEARQFTFTLRAFLSQTNMSQTERSRERLDRFNELFTLYEKNKIDTNTFRRGLTEDVGLQLTPRNERYVISSNPSYRTAVTTFNLVESRAKANPPKSYFPKPQAELMSHLKKHTTTYNL
jgi:hypothetical protein